MHAARTDRAERRLLHQCLCLGRWLDRDDPERCRTRLRRQLGDRLSSVLVQGLAESGRP